MGPLGDVPSLCFVFLVMSCLRSTMYSSYSSTMRCHCHNGKFDQVRRCCHVETPCGICSRHILVPVCHTLPSTTKFLYWVGARRSHRGCTRPRSSLPLSPERPFRFSSRPKRYRSATMRVKPIVARPRSGVSVHHEGKLRVADRIYKSRTLL